MQVNKQLDIYTKSFNGENYYQVVVKTNVDADGFDVIITKGNNIIEIPCSTYLQALAIFKSISIVWMN